MKRVWNISDLSCRIFYQEDKHRMASHLKLPSKKLTPLEKNACETCLLETLKLLLGKTNKVNMRRISFFSDVDQRCTSDLMLLHVISCLFSWLVFNRETLSSCFVRNCKLYKCRCSGEVKIFWFCRVAVEILLWLLLLCKMCWIPL